MRAVRACGKAKNVERKSYKNIKVAYCSYTKETPWSDFYNLCAYLRLETVF